jgi:hypothetical protein
VYIDVLAAADAAPQHLINVAIKKINRALRIQALLWESVLFLTTVLLSPNFTQFLLREVGLFVLRPVVPISGLATKDSLLLLMI